MSNRASYKFIPSWGLYSAALISASLIIQASRWPLFPCFIDIYYHLAVMMGFNAAGGYVGHSFWEFAPIGRPHLYPPLLHIIMLGLFKAGLCKIVIARLLNFAIFPLALSTIWFVVGRIFSGRLAFFTILIASSIYAFYASLLVMIPASLSLLCGILCFLCVEKDKPIAAVIFLAYSFYLHSLMPWVIVLSFLIYIVVNKGKRLRYITTMLLALLFSSPILIWQYINRLYFIPAQVNANLKMDISVSAALFGAAGIVYCMRAKGRHYFPVSFCLSLFLFYLIFFPVYRFRCLSGEGMFGLIWLAAIGADYIYGKITDARKSMIYIILVTILFLGLAPTVFIDQSGISTGLVNSTFTNLVTDPDRYKHELGIALLYPRLYDPLITAIKNYSKADDIIYADPNSFGTLLSVMADRAASNAVLPEVGPARHFDPISISRLIIWIKDEKDVKKEPYDVIGQYKLKKVQETELAFIYENPSGNAKCVTPKAIFPDTLLFSVLITTMVIALFDLLCRAPHPL